MKIVAVNPGDAPALELIRALDDIVNSNTPKLNSYYSSDLLSSAAARDRFVEPDLCDLPEFRDAPGADEVKNG